MKHVFIFLFLLLCVRGHDIVPVSVMEGDSVTLYTDVETIQQEEIRWYYNDIHIAELSGDPNKTCTDVQCEDADERFRDRLKLDHQTGSLTITNITTTDSGVFKLQINSSSDSLLQLFNVSVYYVPEREKMKTAKEGESVTLDPVVVKNPNYLMKWLFNDVRIAEIKEDLSFICTDVQCEDADGRFRDRLQLNNQTGSLTITNTRTTDSGLYYLLIISSRFNIIRSFIVDVTDIVPVSVMEGDSVTLYTDVETIQQEEIRWYYNDIHIAELSGDPNKTCTDVQCEDADERFRDRLKLDHQTGSLTITNITTTDSGVFKLQINSSSDSLLQLFSVSVYYVPEREKMKTAKEGESVTLDPVVVKNPNYLMKWLFNDVRIAEIKEDLSFICTDVQCEDADERFRDRLKLNNQTGSLTITNIRTTDTGLYYLLIISSRFNIIRSFIVDVTGYVDAVSVSVMEGDSVTLHTDVETIQQEEIRWYFNDIHIAELSGDPNKTCTDVQCEDADERFRDRLKLDHQTGSLTITNTRTTDSGVFKLQINSSSDSLLQLFSVSVYYVPEREKMKTVKEGESVTLDPGVVKKPNYLMKWLFNDVRIAEINGDLSFICTDVQCLYADGRFRDRLQLNQRTGSLTITNTRSTDSGLYYLLITTIRFNIIKSFIVDVTGYVDAVSVSVMEGDSVTLYTDVETIQQEEIRWYFNDIRIAQITGDLSFICMGIQCKYSDERFRDRLKLDNQTGSLTITNTRTTDSGLYYKQSISGSSINQGIFSVTVYEVPAAERDEIKRKSVEEGESVTLDTGVIKNPNDWMTWYFSDILIAEITGDQSKICTDDECDERFRDRLKLNHQTGSLTITNTRTTDSGLYKLQISSSSSRISIIKSFSVTVPTVSDSGLSSAAVAGIVVLCVGVAAGVIYYCKRQAGQQRCYRHGNAVQ